MLRFVAKSSHVRDIFSKIWDREQFFQAIYGETGGFFDKKCEDFLYIFAVKILYFFGQFFQLPYKANFLGKSFSFFGTEAVIGLFHTPFERP